MTPVKSSNIAAIEYHPAAQHLDVQFKSGDKWRYHDVSPKAHTSLMGEGVPGHSIGKHFHAHIKGAHKSTKLDD